MVLDFDPLEARLGILAPANAALHLIELSFVPTEDKEGDNLVALLSRVGLVDDPDSWSRYTKARTKARSAHRALGLEDVLPGLYDALKMVLIKTDVPGNQIPPLELPGGARITFAHFVGQILHEDSPRRKHAPVEPSKFAFLENRVQAFLTAYRRKCTLTDKARARMDPGAAAENDAHEPAGVLAARTTQQCANGHELSWPGAAVCFGGGKCKDGSILPAHRRTPEARAKQQFTGVSLAFDLTLVNLPAT